MNFSYLKKFPDVDQFQRLRCQNPEPLWSSSASGLIKALASESWNLVNFINTVLSIVARTLTVKEFMRQRRQEVFQAEAGDGTPRVSRRQASSRLVTLWEGWPGGGRAEQLASWTEVGMEGPSGLGSGSGL